MNVRSRIALVAFAALLLAPAAWGQSAKDLLRKAQRALGSGQINEVVSVIQEIGAVDSPEAAEVLTQIMMAVEAVPNLTDKQAMDLYNASAEALRGISSERGRKFVYDILSNRRADRRMKVAVVDIIASYNDSAGTQALTEAIGVRNQDPRVQIAILRALGRTRTAAAVPAIIDVLAATEKGKGDVWDEARRALREITGEDMATARDWKDFWAARGEGFNPATDRREGGGGGETVLRDQPVIFGSEVTSKNIIIILDISGSMHHREPTSKREIAEGTAVGDPSREDNSAGPCSECNQTHSGVKLSPDRSRINRAKRELVRLVQSLAGDVRFNIVKYNHEVVVWQKDGLIQANPGNKQKAVQWIENIKEVGTTLTQESLRQAFELGDEVNTIYLISDGVPTDRSGNPLRGDAIDAIHEMVANLNKFRQVRINAIAFTGADSAFMEALARNNFGETWSVD